MNNIIITWFLIDKADMITTIRFPIAVVNKFIAAINDFKVTGAYKPIPKYTIQIKYIIIYNYSYHIKFCKCQSKITILI